MANQFDDFVDPLVTAISPALLWELSPLIEEFRVVPVGLDEGVLIFAAEDASQPGLAEDLQDLCKRDIRILNASPVALTMAIDRAKRQLAGHDEKP